MNITESESVELDGVLVEITKSELDGTVVVQIDTGKIAEDSWDKHGPKIRVYLNDGTLYENPPYHKGRKFNHLLDVAFTVVTDKESAYDIPVSVLIESLKARVAALEAMPETEAGEAFGPNDCYEIE